MPNEGLSSKKEKLNNLEEIIPLDKTKNSFYGVLSLCLKDIDRNKIKKDLLLNLFNQRYINWDYFSVLDKEQIVEITNLLRGFLTEEDEKKASLKAKEITVKLENF